MRIIRGAWWALWHPVDALMVAIFALLLLAFPELALLILFVGWELRRRRREQLRVLQGLGFTMRDA